jgi:hypothetical protein
MKSNDVEQHIPVLGVLHLLGGALFAVIGIFLIVFLSGIGYVVDDAETFRILTFVGLTVGTLLIALSVPSMVAGYGLLKRKSWARALALAVAVLNLFNIPIGTLIGAYTLIVLLKTDAHEYFVAMQQA